MRAAIGLVSPLDDFLAPLMLEIDDNIGGLAPFGRDEAFEQQLGAHRVDRGDPEHIADRAVRRRAAALAENLAAARLGDDRMDRPKIGRVIELADQFELMLELRSEEQTSALQSLMRISYAVVFL